MGAVKTMFRCFGCPYKYGEMFFLPRVVVFEFWSSNWHFLKLLLLVNCRRVYVW